MTEPSGRFARDFGDCIEKLDDKSLERALTIAYENLLDPIRGDAPLKPERRGFKKHALEHGWTEERFNEWAQQRRWWIGRMLMQVPARDEATIASLRHRSVQFNGEPPSGGFTCDECGVAPTCTLVFDWYNTNGDCLAEK